MADHGSAAGGIPELRRCMELNTDLTGKVAVVTGASGTLLPTQGGLAFEFLILHHKKSSDIRLGIFCLVVVQNSNNFSPDTGRKRTKAGYHHEGGILPFESLCGKPAYSSGMPALAQASRVAASQTLACTSPMWALPSSSIHRRLWPMPPPME